MKEDYKNRRFQVWEYKVSHASLLIRSPIQENHSTNIDLVFVGVEYMSLPRFFYQIDIDHPSKYEILNIENMIGKKLDKARVVVLVTSNSRYYVACHGFRIEENTMSIFESPFDLYK